MSEKVKEIISRNNVSVMKYLKHLVYHAEYELLQQTESQIMSINNDCQHMSDCTTEL